MRLQLYAKSYHPENKELQATKNVKVEEIVCPKEECTHWLPITK